MNETIINGSSNISLNLLSIQETIKLQQSQTLDIYDIIKNVCDSSFDYIFNSHLFYAKFLILYFIFDLIQKKFEITIPDIIIEIDLKENKKVYNAIKKYPIIKKIFDKKHKIYINEKRGLFQTLKIICLMIVLSKFVQTFYLQYFIIQEKTIIDLLKYTIFNW